MRNRPERLIISVACTLMVTGHSLLKITELVPPQRQNTWGWPAVINFTAGGTGGALYLLSLIFTINQESHFTQASLIPFEVLSAATVGLGFLALYFESGFPSRAHHLFRNIFKSWMSIEVLSGATFIVSALISWRFSHFFIIFGAIAGALGIIISQGFILYQARSMSAWTSPVTVCVLATSGFATASGLTLLNTRMESFISGSMGFVPLFCILSSLMTWILYLFKRRNIECQSCFLEMYRPLSFFYTVGVGHVFPIVAFSVLLFDPTLVAHSIFWIFVGLATITGGILQRAAVLFTAGYHMGITWGADKCQ